jgi:site-specific DNA-methyltransferase (adenine-specific)
MIKLYKGDCLIESDKIESGSVDLILTDLPYGTMEGQSDSGIYHQGKEKHEWDNIIPTDKIMEITNRILRKNGKMILFAQEPFTNKLMNSAIPNLPFNYRAIWLKDTLGSFMRSKKALLYKTEDILIFSKKQCYEAKHPLKEIFFKIYKNHTKEDCMNSMRTSGRFSSEQSVNFHTSIKFGYGNGMVFELMVEDLFNHVKKTIDIPYTYQELKQIDKEHKIKYGSTFNLWEGDKYKSNVFEFKRDRDNYHPTQKPVLLLEDLIKTFSNENDLVVDLTMGSGSTGVAAKNTNRNFIGIEMDENYFDIAQQRIKQTEYKLF